MRIVFMGTPEFAVAPLKTLIDNGYDIVGICTQPDRPKGRGNKLIISPVKELALSAGLNIMQFERIRKMEGLRALRELAPDMIVTAAFGQILSQKILDIPVKGTVNVHASLLPQYRGAAPINWCIINGEKVAGVTTMYTDVGIDTGDMLLACATEILPNETAGELTMRLSVLGAQLLIDTLKGIEAGQVQRISQDASLASHQPILGKEHGLVDWRKPASEIANLVRGVNPWPGAYTSVEDGILKLWVAEPIECEGIYAPGEVIVSSAKHGLVVACGIGALKIIEMQAPSSKRMKSQEYLRGKSIEVGTIFGRRTKVDE